VRERKVIGPARRPSSRPTHLRRRLASLGRASDDFLPDAGSYGGD
jgi:hypothetical protein